MAFDRKAYNREYAKRPGVAERRRERQRERYRSGECDEWLGEYRSRPEVRVRRCRNQRRYRDRNPEKVRGAQRRYFLEHREKMNKSRAEAIARFPEKHKARGKLNKAVERGVVNKPGSCSRCGEEVESHRLHGHHADYSKPLDVEWLCSICHGAERRKDEAVA